MAEVVTQPASFDGSVVGDDTAQVDALWRAQFSALYQQLSHMARRELARGQRHTLDTVAVVSDVFVKLNGSINHAADQPRLLALAAKVMRQVIIDHLRERNAGKRNGQWQQVTLHTAHGLADGRNHVDFLAIERGLQALAQLEPRLVDVVECRFFAGMTYTEIASVFGLTERTVYRDWQRARAFLYAQLGDS